MSDTSDLDMDLILLQLLDEVQSDPPIRCGIDFQWSGTEEEANEVGVHIQLHSALLRRQAPWVDFSSLTGIVFHQDYEQGLREASARAGRDLVATRELGGISLAMIVHRKDGCELIAAADMAHAILSETDAVRNIGLNALRHELCHVDDFARKRRVWKSEFLVERPVGIRATFFPMVESLWSEYYANRVSDSGLADSHLAGEEEMLAGAVCDATQEVQSGITFYRLSRDLEALKTLAMRKLSFVALCMGYVLGRYAARRIATPTAALLNALRDSGFQGTFSASLTELDRLYQMRDSWTSTQDLGALEQLWLQSMCDRGLRFEEQDQGRVYIHVPFR